MRVKKRYLSTGRAAELLGLSDGHVRKLVRDGEIQTAAHVEIPGGDQYAVIDQGEVDRVAAAPRPKRGPKPKPKSQPPAEST